MLRLSDQTYLAIKDVLQKWYGLANDRANLQALVEINELVTKEFNSTEKGGDYHAHS